MDISAFCREIETYLCKKNDGHLIRVVGPSFELVSGWARQGIPLKVAFAGIDRYFERYYRSGPRRRPVKIDFCMADVLDVFDEWRRATGVAGTSEDGVDPSIASGRQSSLPDHLQRAVTRLTSGRAAGTIGEAFDPIIDQTSQALDVARAKAGGLRGAARREVLANLSALDGAMMTLAREQVDAAARATIEQDAAQELAPFRGSMAADAYQHAFAAAVDHLIRTRLNLPTIGFD